MNEQAVIDMIIRVEEKLDGIDKTIKGLESMQKETSKWLRDINSKVRLVEKSMDKLTKGFKKVQNSLKKVRDTALKAFTAIVALNGIPIKLFSNMEAELSNVNTLLNLNRSELAKYEKQLYNLSNKSGKSAVDLAKSLYDVVSLGVEGYKNQIAVMQRATKTSVAGMTTVTNAVKGGMTTLRAYGLELKDLDRIYNLQFKTIKKGKVTYDQLASGISNTLSSAKRLGQDLEGLYGTFAYVTTITKSSEEAGTSLARTFDLLSDRSAKFEEVFKFSIYDSKGNFLGIQKVVEELSTRLEELTVQEKESMLQQVGITAEAARALIPLINNYTDYEKILNEVADSTGAVDEAYEKAIDSIKFQWNQLTKTVTNNLRIFGGMYREEILDIIYKTKTWVVSLGQLVEENKEAIKSITLFLAKITAIITAVALIGGAISALMTPLGLISTGIVAFSALWYLNMFGIREKTLEIWGAIQAEWERLEQEGFIDKIKNWGKKALDVALNLTGDTWEHIQNGEWDKVIGDVASIAVQFVLAKNAVGALGSLLIGDKTGYFSKSTTLGAIASIYFGFKLMSDMKTEDYDTMITRILLAIAGLGLGFAFGGFWGAGLGLSIAAVLDFGGMTDKLKTVLQKLDFGIFGIEVNESAIRENSKRINDKYYPKTSKALGGIIRGEGTGTSDSIIARISNGEFIVNANSTSKYLPLLQAINSNSLDVDNMPKYRTGGLIQATKNLSKYNAGDLVSSQENITYDDYLGMLEEGLVTETQVNNFYLEQKGLGDNEQLKYIANNTKDVKNFTHVTDLISGILNANTNFEETIEAIRGKSEDLEKLYKNMLEKNNQQNQKLEKINQTFSQGLAKAMQSGNINDLKQVTGQSLMGQAQEKLIGQFTEKYSKIFERDFNNLLKEVDLELTGVPDKDFENLLNASDEFREKLEKMGLTVEDTTNKFKASFDDLLNEFTKFTSNMANLTEKEGWNVAGGLLNSANQFKGQFDLFKGAEGLMGKLTAGFGMANAIASGISIIKGINDRKNAKAEEDYKEQIAISKEQLENIKAIKDNTANTVKTLIQTLAKNPTNTNIEQSQAFLNDLTNQLQTDLMPDIPDLNLKVIEDDLLFDDIETLTYSITDALNSIGYSFSDISDMSFEELQNLRDTVNNLDTDSIEDMAKALLKLEMPNGEFGGLKEEDLENVKEAINTYVDMLEDLIEAQDNLKLNSRMESFEGIEILSKEEAVEQYTQQIEKWYEQAGLSVEEHREEIDKLAEKWGENGAKITTIMNNVRGAFKSAFASGKGALESFAGGLKPLFDSLKSNIAGLVYDINFSEINKRFEDFYTKIHEKMAEYEGNDPLGFVNDLLKGGELGGLFKEMINLTKNMGSMESINETLASQFREQAEAAGLTEETINKTLISMGLLDDEAKKYNEELKKAEEIDNKTKNALKNAFSEALDNRSKLDFYKAMGQSIYENAKQGLINAFMEEEVYKKMFKKWFDTKDIEFTGDLVKDFETGTSMLDSLEGELRKAGLGFDYNDVATAGGNDGGSTGGNGFYGGASVSGESTKIVNNNYYYQPSNNKYFGSREEEYRRFLEWKRDLKDKE